MSEFKLFSFAYKDYYKEELPEQINLDQLNQELLNYIEIINDKARLENYTKRLQENASEENIKIELVDSIQKKYKTILQVSSLLKSFLDFFSTITKNVEKSYHNTLSIMKKQSYLVPQEKLEEIDIQMYIDKWSNEVQIDLERDREKSKNELEHEVYNVIDCVKCHKRPAAYYSQPCGHASYCEKCMKEMTDNNTKPESLVCLCCHKSVDKVIPIKL